MTSLYQVSSSVGTLFDNWDLRYILVLAFYRLFDNCHFGASVFPSCTPLYPFKTLMSFGPGSVHRMRPDMIFCYLFWVGKYPLSMFVHVSYWRSFVLFGNSEFDVF